MNTFLQNKANLKLLSIYTQIAEDVFFKIPETILTIRKDNLSNAEYKEYLLFIEATLKRKYIVSRMPMVSMYYYILKVKRNGLGEE